MFSVAPTTLGSVMRSCTRRVPSPLAPCTATASFSTATTSRPSILSHRPPPASHIRKACAPPLQLPSSHQPITRPSVRYNTTTSVPSAETPTTISTAPSPPPSISAPPIPTTTPTPASSLTWNQFLRLRRVRRRYTTISSILTALATTGGGIILLSDQSPNSLGSRVASLGELGGLDPIVVLGLSTITAGVVGWLLGPVFGGAVFRVVKRDVVADMAVKEKQFFQRIKAHRVDPTSSSMSNPVPDYYGEKIGSVADYRRWLKDQRAFNKKRQSYV